MSKKRDVSRFKIGQMVEATAGHDTAKVYVIIDIQGERLFLADGKRKTVENPKVKNICHVRRMNYIDPAIEKNLDQQIELNNEMVQEAVVKFEKRFD